MNANKRLVPIEIEGTEYYLNCGFGFMSDVSDRYGGLENAMAAMQDEGGNPMATIIFVLHALLRDGTEYMQLRGQPDFPEMSEKGVRVLFGMRDAEWVMPKIALALSCGQEREVEVKPDPKNGKAAGGKKASRGTTTTQKESD